MDKFVKTNDVQNKIKNNNKEDKKKREIMKKNKEEENKYIKEHPDKHMSEL